ncbi:hypothetical protein FQR65_LT07922 [Abscondita terminalis]|nr:hypothetical protein FQR65_LT07922 [Abscondita terminalis]
MELCLQNDSVCVYSSKDWKKLRKEYRIVGEYLGSSQTTPTFPIKLLPEEAILLINKNIAKLVRYPKLLQPSKDDEIKKYDHLRIQLQQAEQIVCKEYRKKELEKYVDQIVEAKKRKRNEDYVSQDSVLDVELNKVQVTEDNMIWPILTEPLNCTEGMLLEFNNFVNIKFLLQGSRVEVSESVLMKQTTFTKAAVFADLWEKNYYITCGKKFGGDFLVYMGDPIAFHAVYIIRCVEDPQKLLHTSDLVAFGRLGTAVKKKSVLATCTNKSVNYITINWLDL